MTTFDLRSVRVRSGEEHRDTVDVAIAPVELGGERYVAVPEQVRAALGVTRASTGWVFELRFAASPTRSSTSGSRCASTRPRPRTRMS